jgi:cytochrome c
MVTRSRILAAALVLACGALPADELDDRIAAANPKRGQLLYLQCKACHDVEAGIPHKVGPNLSGIFGRTAGTVPGFKFTDAMAKSGIVWTPATMDTWLKQPGAMIPGNGMAFPGIAADNDRAAVIAYMLASTGKQ